MKDLLEEQAPSLERDKRTSEICDVALWQDMFILFQLKHLTGSTANVYLEYIQRNLPEGVAMEVTKVWLEFLPHED